MAVKEGVVVGVGEGERGGEEKDVAPGDRMGEGVGVVELEGV